MQEITQVLKSKEIKKFVGEEDKVKCHTRLVGEPVKMLSDGNMLSGLCAFKNLGIRVMDILESVQLIYWTVKFGFYYSNPDEI